MARSAREKPLVRTDGAGASEPLPSAGVSSKQRAFAAGSLCVAIAVAFAPMVNAGFVDWDDRENFVDNPHLRGFDSASLGWMFTSFHLGHYQPFAWLTLAADHSLWGLDARGYHVTNVVIHALTTLALLAFARRFLDAWHRGWSARRRAWAATLAAALFALHPLRCESVCWITERRDVLSGLFFVLALHSWLAWLEHRKKRAYAATLALQLASLLSKAWALVLPALLWILWRALAGRDGRLRERRVGARELAPFASLSAVFAIVTLVAQTHGTDARATLGEHGLDARAVQLCFAALFYATRTLVPLDLSPHYELPPRAELFTFPYLGPALLAAAGIVALVALRARAPAVWWSVLAYLAILAPVSGIAQAGPQLVADRYSYLACIPLALGGAALLCSPRLPSWISAAIAGVTVVALIAATRAQCAVWQDSDALWARAIAHDPRSAVALDHVAQAHVRRIESRPSLEAKRAELETAARLYARALERSRNPLHLMNLGGVERLWAELEPARRGEHLREALRRVEEALASAAPPPAWRRTHAALLADVGRSAEGETELEAVVRALPDDVAARFVYAQVLEQRGAWSESAEQREHVCRLRPSSIAAWRALGAARSRAGDAPRARAALLRALELARPADDSALVESLEAELTALGG